MHADHRVLQAETHLSYGQRRGVGREDGAFLAHRIELVQQLTLGGHFFLDAFDNQIGVGSSGLFFHEDVGQQSINGFLSHFALFDALLQRLGQVVFVALSGCNAGSVHQSGVSFSSEDLSDTAAHGAGAKNCYFHDRFPPKNDFCLRSFVRQSLPRDDINGDGCRCGRGGITC